MRTLHFGEARTELPDDWRSKVDSRGVTIAAPPHQSMAFLWLSTLSGKPPDKPGFNPLDGILSHPDAPQPTSLEDHGDCVIAQFVHTHSKLETHTFRVLPKKAFPDHWAQAILTLSIKQEARDSEFVRGVVQQTWEIARKIRFDHDTKA
jgi:hypothetical protein